MTTSARQRFAPALPLLLTLPLWLALSPVWAQYKVIGPDGRVSYTDQPPADTNAKVQPVTISGNGGAPDLGSLPSSLREVASRYPVTLYASTACPGCDTARKLLTQRGIPFREKRVETPADLDALSRLTGGFRGLPLLTLGSQQVRSLSSGEWQTYLDAAGYPKTSQLPAGYRNPAPVPLAPPAEPAKTPAATAPVPSSLPEVPAETGDGLKIRF